MGWTEVTKTTIEHRRATTPALRDDLLIGAQAIADEIGIDIRKAFYWLQKGHIPAKKIGDLWTSTRSALRRHFEGEAA